MVEHVSAREEQDGNQADGGPEVAVLDHGQDPRPRHAHERDDTKQHRRGRHDTHVVEGAVDGREGALGQMA